MEVKNKNTDNIRTAVSHERRDFLKAGVAMAAAPLFVGMVSAILPTKAQAVWDKHQKVLIIYYSKTGNTKAVAEMIQAKTNGAIYRIETVKTYPMKTPDSIEIPRQELESGNLPDLKGTLLDLSGYDMIFVGSPVWWYTVSTPVMRFLKDVNFAGKKVAAFNTNAGGVGQFHTHFKALARNAVTYDGISFIGSYDDGWGPAVSGKEFQAERRDAVGKRLDQWLATLQ